MADSEIRPLSVLSNYGHLPVSDNLIKRGCLIVKMFLLSLLIILGFQAIWSFYLNNYLANIYSFLFRENIFEIERSSKYFPLPKEKVRIFVSSHIQSYFYFNVIALLVSFYCSCLHFIFGTYFLINKTTQISIRRGSSASKYIFLDITHAFICFLIL